MITVRHLVRRNRLLAELQSVPVIRKGSRFALVGALSGLFYLVVLLLLTDILDTPPQVASVIAYIAALPLNFIGQRHFAFGSANHWRGDLVRYAGLVLLSLAASYCIVWLISVKFGLPPLLGGLATILCIPVLTYVCMDRFVFGLWKFRAKG
jgi:putative flippase GtrA